MKTLAKLPASIQKLHISEFLIRMFLGTLYNVEGDVLHLLECCNGGGAALDNPHEVLATSASQSRDRPYWIKGVELVGVLPSSSSSVMLITLPISLWDVLPEHPAYPLSGQRPPFRGK